MQSDGCLPWPASDLPAAAPAPAPPGKVSTPRRPGHKPPMGQIISAAQPIDAHRFEAEGSAHATSAERISDDRLTELGEQATVVRRLEDPEHGRYNAVVRAGEQYYLARLETDS